MSFNCVTFPLIVDKILSVFKDNMTIFTEKEAQREWSMESENENVRDKQ